MGTLMEGNVIHEIAVTCLNIYKSKLLQEKKITGNIDEDWAERLTLEQLYKLN